MASLSNHMSLLIARDEESRWGDAHSREVSAGKRPFDLSRLSKWDQSDQGVLVDIKAAGAVLQSPAGPSVVSAVASRLPPL